METSWKAEKPSKFLIQQSLTMKKMPCAAQGTIFSRKKRTYETHKSKRKHCREEHSENGP